MRLGAMLLALALVGACQSSLKNLGEQCFGTSECDPGLTCDLGQSPPVCAEGQSGGIPDAALPADDAAVVDAAAEPDAPIGEPDAMPEPDAAPEDAGTDDAGADDAGTTDAA